MKHLKKLLFTAAAFLFCMTAFIGTSNKAHAATPTTYYLKYVDSLGQFRYMLNTWTDGQEHFDVTALTTNIQDGDTLIIDGTGTQGITLTVNVSLGNLTVASGDYVIVTAKSIKEFYGLDGSKTVINGNVKTAHLYKTCLANFNNDVESLNVHDVDLPTTQATASVLGTCSAFHIENGTNAYSFAKNTFRLVNGVLTTNVNNFSWVAPSGNTTSVIDDEYDDVPKTADSRINPLWFVALSFVCLTGSICIKKMK